MAAGLVVANMRAACCIFSLGTQVMFSTLSRGYWLTRFTKGSQPCTWFSTKSLSYNFHKDDAYWGLGELYLVLGNNRLAKANLEEAVKINPDHFEAELGLTEIDFNWIGRKESASKFCRILKSNPGNLRIAKRIKRFYFEHAKDLEGWAIYREVCNGKTQN